MIRYPTERRELIFITPIGCPDFLDYVVITSLGSTRDPDMRRAPFVVLLVVFITVSPFPSVVLFAVDFVAMVRSCFGPGWR